MSLKDDLNIDADGSIYLLAPYINGMIGNQEGITLDGSFSVEDLELILSLMRNNEIEIPPERLEVLNDYSRR